MIKEPIISLLWYLEQFIYILICAFYFNIFFNFSRLSDYNFQVLFNLQIFTFKVGRVSILTPFKLEELYIDEWIDYHLKLGFDHIHLIDNNDGDHDDVEMIKRLKNSSFSSHLSFENKRNVKRYNDYFVSMQNNIWKYLKKEDWLFVNLNIDEFLTFPNTSKYGHNIKEYLRHAIQKKCDIICFNWQIYGNNGHIYQTEGKVLERFPNPTLPFNFTREKNVPDNTVTKCMGHGGLGTPIFLHDIQFNKEKGQLSCNGDLEPGKKKSMTYSPLIDGIYYSNAYLKHFTTKSTEEWFKFKMKKYKHDFRYKWNYFNAINKHFPNTPFNESVNYSFLYK